jgi:hypothetical protein
VIKIVVSSILTQYSFVDYFSEVNYASIFMVKTYSFRNWLYYAGGMQENWPPASRRRGRVGSSVRANGEKAARATCETIFAFHVN